VLPPNRDLFYPVTVTAKKVFQYDSRHYAKAEPHIYRLNPMVVGTLFDLRWIHGTDERSSLGNYAQCVKFCHQLIRHMDLS
jgi:hypothetical protein